MLYENKKGGIMQQMNIDLTVKQFFEDVEKYIAKIRALYVEEAAKQEFDNMFIKYTELKKQIEYAVKLPDSQIDERRKLLSRIFGNTVRAELFVKPYSRDYSVYHAFCDVINTMTNYYRVQVLSRNPEALLDKIKSWKYKTSTSIFKDFVYPFLPLSYFAVKTEVK